MKTNNQKDIAIYGASGYGREIACLLKAINQQKPQWNLIGFFDDGLSPGHKNEYGEILGGITELNNYSKKYLLQWQLHILKPCSILPAK